MGNENKCPHCGKPVPPTTLGGICPECMLKAGLAAQTEGPDGIGPHGTKVVQPPPSPAEIAALFPQLEILECLGRGGMGVVYKARQPRLNRPVALKILARDKEQDAQFTERFAREAQALARLNHPNIVTVHDFGEAGGHCYLVMEFVDGLNLRQLLQAGKMKPEQALTIVPKICEALQYAHEQGIIHRDIKPENILLDRQGRVKIADFGIAKMLGAESGQPALTGAKDVVGTPHYMAPEQIEKPATVDHRADIYSLGVVFYEMLTGELPLGKFAPPSSKVHIDVRLDEVVLHSLEKEPARRYQHASEVKTRVETIAATLPHDRSTDDRESVRQALKTPARGLIAAGALQLLFCLALLVFGVALLKQGEEPAAYLGIGFVALVFLVFAVVVLLGASQMMKLRNYPFSVVTCAVAALAGPGALLGLPFGVWALVQLIRPDVRAAFEANRSQAGSTAKPDPGKMDFARSQVKGPAIGLVITGVLDWVLMTVACIIGSLNSAGGLFIWLPFLAIVLSSCIIYAGLKFMQLERRVVVMLGSVLAMFVSPGNLIGLPLGIWALVVLNRRDVREAFEANRECRKKAILSVPPTAQKPDHFWKWFGLTLLALIAILFCLVLAEVVIPNKIRDRKMAFVQHQREEAARKFGAVIPFTPRGNPEFGPATELTLPIHDKGYSDCLNLDSGKIVATPVMETPWEWATTLLPYGVMVIPQTTTNPTILAGTSTLVWPLPAGTDRWDGRMALADATAPGTRGVTLGQTVTASNAGDLPRLFAFQTPLGKRGLLQVTSLTENPRGVKIRYKLVQQNASASAEHDLTLDDQLPVVVETFPVSGARDVEPGITEIRVRFSKEMADGSWSWSTAWQDSAPESIGEPRYEPDHRTCVLKVKLEPGRTYAWWLNSDKFKNFTDQAGRPAVPYLLIFQTKQN